MLTRLAVKLGGKLGVKWALAWVRGAAEGKHGKFAQELYWRLVGWKVAIGFGLAAGGAAVLVLEGPAWLAVGITSLGGLLLQAGILDKAWRGVRPEWLERSELFRLAAQNPADIATAFGLAFTWQANQCAFGATWCALILWALAVFAGVAVQLGLLDAAWRARLPFPVARSAKAQELIARKF